QAGEGWINGGYFVFEPGVLNYIAGDETHLEREPLERLAADGQLVAYRHHDFWQCMDTMRDHPLLESLWASGTAPWKVRPGTPSGPTAAPSSPARPAWSAHGWSAASWTQAPM